MRFLDLAATSAALAVTVEFGSSLGDLREHAAVRVVVLLDDP
ncbi:hypothetical protein AB0M35_28520 [Micromonospora sp. NPDC051196]